MAEPSVSFCADYHKSLTYKKADTPKRRQLERYKAALSIGSEQMAWLMYLQDLRTLPKEARQKGNLLAEVFLMIATLIFLSSIAMQNRPTMLLGAVLVISGTILYLSGLLNPFTGAVRQAKKALKGYPAVPAFPDWEKENPAP